ncbi:MAG: hypothetical protein F4X36_14075 [Gammaproteobacteria bacterium]|nr:hypothetical protein [Gammaproteobacteria bacterium]
MIEPADSGLWADIVPDHRSVTDPGRWEFLDTSADKSFDPWTSGVTVYEYDFGAGQGVLSIVRVNRSANGLQQQAGQRIPEGWPVIIQWFDAADQLLGSYTGYAIHGFNFDTGADFEFILAAIQDLFHFPLDGHPHNILFLNSAEARARTFIVPSPAPAKYVVTPYQPPAAPTEERELRTTEFANRVYRVRYDRRIEPGSTVTDEEGTGWLVDDVREALTRRGFLDVYAKREVATSDALVRTSSRTIGG